MAEDSPYDYVHTTPYVKGLLPDGYVGNVYRLSDSWTAVFPTSDTPYTILEIGAYHGSNICSLMKTYARHAGSKIHCVDPWYDYEEYSEYKDAQSTNYSIFLKNITKLAPIDLNKIYLYRGLSEDIVPTFSDNMFDIIFIDGNHETKYTLEDAVLCFKKLKPGGWMIFDDMQSEVVSRSVDVFISIYRPFVKNLAIHNGQFFLQKI